MVILAEPKRAAEIEDVVVEQQPEAEYEFLIHHMGWRFWVDCWVVRSSERSKCMYIKIPWVVKIESGEKKGLLRVSSSSYKYRWLMTDAQLARLRKK